MSDTKILSLVPILVGSILLATQNTNNLFLVVSSVGLILIGAIVFLGPAKVKKSARRRRAKRA